MLSALNFISGFILFIVCAVGLAYGFLYVATYYPHQLQICSLLALALILFCACYNL